MQPKMQTKKKKKKKTNKQKKKQTNKYYIYIYIYIYQPACSSITPLVSVVDSTAGVSSAKDKFKVHSFVIFGNHLVQRKYYSS